jgi:hypothetical protein
LYSISVTFAVSLVPELDDSLIGEPNHLPAVGLSDAFDGTALDLDAPGPLAAGLGML